MIRRGDIDTSSQIESRTIAYLAYLSLIEKAFSPDGPVSAFSTEKPCTFVQLPRGSVEAFDDLLQTREIVPL